MERWLEAELKKVPQLQPTPDMYALLQNRAKRGKVFLKRTRWYFAAAALLLLSLVTVSNYEQIFYPVPPPSGRLETRSEVEDKEEIAFDRTFKMHKKMGIPQAELEMGEAISDIVTFHFQREDSFFATDVDMDQPLEYPVGLNEQDNYQIIVTPGVNSYLYLFQLNSEQILIKLFPDEAIDLKNPLESSGKYILPGEDEWYHLDQLTGEEKIYLSLQLEESEKLMKLYNAYSRTRSASKQKKRLAELLQELERLESRILILENQ